MHRSVPLVINSLIIHDDLNRRDLARRRDDRRRAGCPAIFAAKGQNDDFRDVSASVLLVHLMDLL